MKKHVSAKVRDCLTLQDYSSKEINQILGLTKDIKEHPDKFHKSLQNVEFAMIFAKTSTRTRISFEVAANQMGAHPIFLDWRTTNLTLGSIEDEIRCISEYVDLIMARVYEHESLKMMSHASKVPIINGLSDEYHPCQALADIYTIKEHFQDLTDKKITFIGDTSNNVASSLINICAQLGLNLALVGPEIYKPQESVLQWVEKNHKNHRIEFFTDAEKGVADSDVLYTDTFVSMGQESEEKERLDIFKPYQLNEKIVGLTKKKDTMKILHCLPAHRGVEITSKMLDSRQSVVFQQAQNRLHTQKALMLFLMKSEYSSHSLQ